VTTGEAMYRHGSCAKHHGGDGPITPGSARTRSLCSYPKSMNE
jgi:hypothetical protein